MYRICTHDSGIIHTDYALFEGGIILYQNAGLGHMRKQQNETSYFCGMTLNDQKLFFILFSGVNIMFVYNKFCDFVYLIFPQIFQLHTLLFV